MVQMKAFGIFSTSISLTPFISHMVQMKAGSESIIEMPVKIFISHMVQMKGVFTKLLFFRRCSLYIPHGSDERRMSNDCEKYSCFVLYIPHGSDERAMFGN